MIKTKAAVAFEAGMPLEIVEVDLEGPKAGEVLVEMKATGVCHTDAFTLSGEDPEGAFPAILGHEGAGIVVEVGKGVKSLSLEIMSYLSIQLNVVNVSFAFIQKLIYVRRLEKHKVKA